MDKFIGREKELKLLEDFLDSAHQIAILHGIEGIGKSELLKEFVRRSARISVDIHYVASWPMGDSSSIASFIEGNLRKGVVLVVDDFDRLDQASRAMVLVAFYAHWLDLGNKIVLSMTQKPEWLDENAFSIIALELQGFSLSEVKRYLSDKLPASLKDPEAKLLASLVDRASRGVPREIDLFMRMFKEERHSDFSAPTMVHSERQELDLWPETTAWLNTFSNAAKAMLGLYGLRLDGAAEQVIAQYAENARREVQSRLLEELWAEREIDMNRHLEKMMFQMIQFSLRLAEAAKRVDLQPNLVSVFVHEHKLSASQPSGLSYGVLSQEHLAQAANDGCRVFPFCADPSGETSEILPPRTPPKKGEGH